MATVRVTIVMSWRERHDLTVPALETLLRHTATAYRLVVLDFDMPSPLRAAVQARVPDATIVPIAHSLWPTEARGQVAAWLDTPFAVFMDNDVLVSPGWLEQLLACADATGAGIVSPLVLIGDRPDSGRIHFAGGTLVTTADTAGTVMVESHRLVNRSLTEVEALLRRSPCDFAEYHCMLMRREVYAAPEVFDPAIHCVHEHIHAALCARRLGYPVWVETAARVTYLAMAPLRLAELARLRWRWNLAAGERSIQAFGQRWGVPDDARSFGGVRQFLRNHHTALDPLRPGAPATPDALAPMPETALRQTLGGLLELAAQRGYDTDDLYTLRRAWWEVLILMDGGYRPCGRPFVNHLAGCASVLVHYRFATPLVVAALHHSTYTHFPNLGSAPTAQLVAAARAAGRRGAPAPQTPPARLRSAVNYCRALWHRVLTVAEPDKRRRKRQAAAAAKLVGGVGSPVERQVRAYTLRDSRWAGRSVEDWQNGSVDEVRALMIAAANDIELYLSGEIRDTGRRDTLGAETRAAVRACCAALGVPGLALTLDNACVDGAHALTSTVGSFRLRAGRMVPMARRAPLVKAGKRNGR